MSTIKTILRKAFHTLAQNGIPEANREARNLLSLALKKEKAFMIAHSEYRPDGRELKRFREFVSRRAGHEPFQYIAGFQEFYGLNFIVTPDVMIPRPETEMIVECAVELLRERDKPRICEIGVGSGCISVSILSELEAASGVGADISEKALSIARRNAVNVGVSERLSLSRSDIFNGLDEELFDLVVSNPPYVPEADVRVLQAEVRDFEPRIALTDGGDGLSIIERIINEAPERLRPDGFLVLEIGFNQSNQISGLLESRGWGSVNFLPDLQGIPRTVKARFSRL